MTDLEILRDLFRNLAAVVHRTLDGVSPEALRWQPDQEANSQMPSGALYQPAAGWPNSQITVYELLRNLLTDSHEHIGEIKAIRAMWERKTG